MQVTNSKTDYCVLGTHAVFAVGDACENVRKNCGVQ